ncbi:MAG: hypothetical protein AAF478_14490 [Pseudomonadota bacterium]
MATDPATVLDFPTFATMQASMSRSRLSAIPSAPKTLGAINVVHLIEKFKFDDNSEFFAADSGQNDPKRIVIFSSPQQDLRRLETVDTIRVDGTFWTVPHIFHQLLTIHAEVYGQNFPFLYCLLPDKSEETYRKTFVMITNLCRERNI